MEEVVACQGHHQEMAEEEVHQELQGKVVEEGPGDRIFSDPQAPISQVLVEACPRLPR